MASGLELLAGALFALLQALTLRYVRNTDEKLDNLDDRVATNERFRRAATGDDTVGRQGRWEDVDELHDQIRRDHRETQQALAHLSERVDVIVEALNESDAVDDDIDPPETDRWRTD